MQIETFEVDFENEGERLDKYISMLFPEQSRSFFQKIIKDGHVTVNDKIEKAKQVLTANNISTLSLKEKNILSLYQHFR